MIRLVRPEEPEIYGARKKRARSPAMTDIHRRFRLHFWRAQHGKCAYCECSLIGQPGDVDHYAPRNAVTHLLVVRRSDPGHPQTPASASPGVPAWSEPIGGYLWLALEWTNWILACEICNRAWKGALFPISAPGGTAIHVSGVVGVPHPGPPSGETYERRLLLNPFDTDRSPENHLYFDDQGIVQPRAKSECGLATIQTCGLDRTPLVDARRITGSGVRYALSRYAKELEDCNFLSAYDQLRLACWAASPTQPHAAVARSVIQDLLEVEWEEALYLLWLLRALTWHDQAEHQRNERSAEWALGLAQRVRRLEGLSPIWHGYAGVVWAAWRAHWE